MSSTDPHPSRAVLGHGHLRMTNGWTIAHNVSF
jgi:hypothetical protein